MLLLYGKPETDSMKLNILLNSCILVVPFLLSLFYPDIGTLAGYLGSVSALFCIYILPTLTYLKYKYTEINNPILAEALKNNKFTVKNPKE